MLFCISQGARDIFPSYVPKCSLLPLLYPWLGFEPCECEFYVVQLTIQEVAYMPGNHKVYTSVYMREMTWTKVLCHALENCDAMCQHMDHTSASHSTLIGADHERGMVATAYYHLSVFQQTSTTDKHLQDGLLSVRQQTLAVMDWPSCFIWDVSATAGSVWQP